MRSKVTSATGLLIMIIFVSFFGVAGQGKGPAAQARLAAPTHMAAAQGKVYKIGPEDVLDIDVWKQPELTRAVPVRPDGKISLPLLGDVQAAGFTPMELGNSIQKELLKYVSNPQVTVIVTAINSQRIYVLGEVARPGPERLYPNMTVLQALSAAGGPTQYADRKKIYILRHNGAKEEQHPFNYKSAIRGGPTAQAFMLRPGDTIIVP